MTQGEHSKQDNEATVAVSKGEADRGSGVPRNQVEVFSIKAKKYQITVKSVNDVEWVVLAIAGNPKGDKYVCTLPI